jgi:hypothetical protein
MRLQQKFKAGGADQQRILKLKAKSNATTICSSLAN